MLPDLSSTKTNHWRNLASNCGEQRMQARLMLRFYLPLPGMIGLESSKPRRRQARVMTIRQNFRGYLGFGIAAMLAWALWAPGSALYAAPSVWRDQASGFAIGGYDPVAYHTQSKPLPGSEGLEHRWGGAVWQFINVGNRDAFAKHPEIYAPRFAGYDALALTKGLTVRGHPAVWAMYKARVFLFRDVKSLRAWRRDREKIIAQAQANWSTLGENLPGTSEW